MKKNSHQNSKATSSASRPKPQLVLSKLESDDQVISLWLSARKNPHTHRAYEHDIALFRAAVPLPLNAVDPTHVDTFVNSLRGSKGTQARVVNVLKSLLSYAHRVGYLQTNVGMVLRSPSNNRGRLVERILSETDVLRLIASENSPRNRALIRLLYNAGLRVSEACALTWHDLRPREDAGQVTVHGKGDKTRTVLISTNTWRELQALRTKRTKPDEPLFRSRSGRHLDVSSVFRIVRAAAEKAELEAPVSPHWLRHAHASHALDRGAPIHLVQATLGHANVATTCVYLHAKPNDSSARYLSI